MRGPSHVGQQWQWVMALQLLSSFSEGTLAVPAPAQAAGGVCGPISVVQQVSTWACVHCPVQPTRGLRRCVTLLKCTAWES